LGGRGRVFKYRSVKRRAYLLFVGGGGGVDGGSNETPEKGGKSFLFFEGGSSCWTQRRSGRVNSYIHKRGGGYLLTRERAPRGVTNLVGEGWRKIKREERKGSNPSEGGVKYSLHQKEGDSLSLTREKQISKGGEGGGTPEWKRYLFSHSVEEKTAGPIYPLEKESIRKKGGANTPGCNCIVLSSLGW